MRTKVCGVTSSVVLMLVGHKASCVGNHLRRWPNIGLIGSALPSPECLDI